MITQQRKVINISVPPKLSREISAMARAESKTKSELLRDAFRVYQFRKEWAKIRLLGEQTARRMKIETVDDVERIAG